MTMAINSNDVCIVIASHISNANRIHLLFECLNSLLQQKIVIPIYLSISFETEEYKQAFALLYSEQHQYNNPILSVIVKSDKTPQMRHIQELLTLIDTRHKWIMFCDDDDTYDDNRTEIFLQNIAHCIQEVSTMPGKMFAGLYESNFGKDHREQRHEFWCYCVHILVLQNFMDTVRNYPEYLDHSCCDVLFGEYLRRMGPDYLFGPIKIHMYNYRVTDNSDSVTGTIQKRNKEIRLSREVTEENKVECAKELNGYLNENLTVYLHDTFLRTLIGSNFENILQNEFKSEVNVLHLIDGRFMSQLLSYHNHLRDVCNKVYMIKI
jgi:hypothetical protein